jgi:hypothetical protein
MADGMSYETYWRAVMGDDRSAEDVVWDFDLVGDKASLDEWLGEAEAEARLQGLDDDGAIARHHARALAELLAAR